MEFGVILPNSGALARADALYAIAETAESLGFDALWTADHLVLPVESSTAYPYLPGASIRLEPDHPFLEPLVVLAGVAARTSRIRLGVSVYLSALRHPIVAAKLVATLDQLSGGRVVLGVGAGWIPEEYETLGVPFAERGAVLDEQIEALRALFRDDRPRYAGKYFRFDNLGFEPKPLRRDVPIWVGGNSRAARRRAARLGDGWHVIDVPLPELESGVADLRAQCRALGRAPGAVSISMRAQLALTAAHVPPEKRMAPLTGPLDEVLDDLRRYRALGVGHLALWPGLRPAKLGDSLDQLKRLATDIVAPLRAEDARSSR